jgi:DNA-binding XRE family transcriptional regulator
MANPTKDLFLQLAKASGYCCIFALFRANARLSSREIATILGVEKRTVMLWRRAYRLERLTACSRCPRLLGLHSDLRFLSEVDDT